MPEDGEVEELGIEPHEAGTERTAEPDTEAESDRHDDQHQLQVVGGDARVGIAKRLEGGDLFALGGDEARDHDVEQEGRHAEEDRRQYRAEDLLLPDLAIEDRMRNLVLATVGLAHAVRLQPARQLRHDIALGCAGRELGRHLGERSIHVVGSGQGVAVDPEHAEATHVRMAAEAGEDVLGRERGTDDEQVAFLAIDQRRDGIAGFETPDIGESRRYERLYATVAPGAGLAELGGPARAHHDAVHALWLPVVDPDQATDDRVAHVLEPNPHHVLDGGLHVGDARYGAQALLEGVGGALDRREYIGEPLLGIESIAGDDQRIDRAQAGDEAADAAGHHQRDGERLAPHAREVAQQLAVERQRHPCEGKQAVHQESSDGVSRVALRSMPRIRPSPSRMMRSAMRAIAALWVMTTTVVPSSRLIRSITSSTSLPVS